MGETYMNMEKENIKVDFGYETKEKTSDLKKTTRYTNE